MNETPDSVELWGQEFTLVDKGIAVDEIVPFVSRMVFAMSRLLGYVDELGRQVDAGNSPGRHTGLDDKRIAALAETPPAPLTSQRAEREASVARTAVWPTGIAEVDERNGSAIPSAESEIPSGKSEGNESVLEGELILRFTPVHSAGDMAWVNKALETIPGIDRLRNIAAGPTPGTLDVGVSLKEPVSLFRLTGSGIEGSLIEDGVVQIVAAGDQKAG